MYRYYLRYFLLALSLLLSGQSFAETLALTQTEMERLNHLFPSTEGSGEHVSWDKKPIDIVLPVGKEKLVTFPGPVEFGYDVNKLPDDALTVQNNNSTLYLTAKNTFAPQRVQVRLSNTNKIVLLNLSAKNNASTTPIIISTTDNTRFVETSKVSSLAIENPEPSKPISMANLTRFAVQSLYAPKRLLPQSSAIFRTSMQAYKTEPLLLDGSVIAQPDASWRSSRLYVTAVLLRNQLSHSQLLDPRVLCGQWRAATFYPRNQLAAKGSTNDYTHVFLVSDKPFGKAVGVCHPA